MKLQYPYALLLLLAIPVLILIYILRNKYREETAPSTYIWELSQKFMKKRNPLRKVEHLLALIVEILTIAGMSLALAHPTFVLTGQADNIVFVLDGSASMNMTHEENKTRFESAKEQIAKVAKDAKTGSAFTLVLASDQAHVVCESVTDKTRFEMYLESTKASYLSSTLDDSMTVAQQFMSNGTTNVCYLATDKKILETYTKNVNVLSVYDDSKNYAINSLSYVYYPVSSKREKPQIGISGTATSYTCDEKLRIHFYVNDESIGYSDFDTKANTPLVLSLPDQDVTYTSADAIKSVKAVIDNEDALMLDNTFTIYNNEAGSTTRVLVVSDSPFYFKAIFQALNNVSATIISSSSYSSSYTGYDITVFDSYTPSALPKTGAVWFFGTDTVSDCGFLAQKQETIDGGGTLVYANNSDLLYQELTSSVSAKKDIIVSKYVRYSLPSNGSNFTSILNYISDTKDTIPAVFAGKNPLGQREVVFAFDLHDSNLPLLYDFVVLMRNFVDYSNPQILSTFSYENGESTLLSLPDNLTDLVAKLPSGKEVPLDTANDQTTFTLSEVGNYQITATYDDGSTKDIFVYSQYPKEEENPSAIDSTDHSIVLPAEVKKGDGLFDNILPWVIAAAVFFSVDWILYTYEQY